MFASLNPRPAAEHPQLAAPTTFAALRYLPQALVFEIDPSLSDTQTLCRRYSLPLNVMGNAVLVLGKREGEQRQACCMVLGDRRVDVNNIVKRKLDVRKASFAPMNYAVEQSGMEYGGITPVGLDPKWPLWLDETITRVEWLCIGSGVRRSKLLLPGESLLNLPGAVLVPDLTRQLN
jgi:prolyl-tRNA editing enzyme YbaK/EbsC (Cys-tRNA(Pro) deacylase)